MLHYDLTYPMNISVYPYLGIYVYVCGHLCYNDDMEWCCRCDQSDYAWCHLCREVT